MGLSEVIEEEGKRGVKWQHEKLHNEELCPRCGSDNTDAKEHYRRCENPDCDTLTYLPNTR